MILKRIWKPINFYSIISALICIPISFSFEYLAGFFLLANLFLLINFNNILLGILNSEISSSTQDFIIRFLKASVIIILPFINFLISFTASLLISWLFGLDQEGNVFAFTLIYMFIPYFILYLIAVFRYFSYLNSFGKEKMKS